MNGRPIRRIFHRFQNVPASCERSLINEVLMTFTGFGSYHKVSYDYNEYIATVCLKYTQGYNDFISISEGIVVYGIFVVDKAI